MSESSGATIFPVSDIAGGDVEDLACQIQVFVYDEEDAVMDKKKTITVDRTLQPEFNDSLYFKIPDSVMFNCL